MAAEFGLCTWLKRLPLALKHFAAIQRPKLDAMMKADKDEKD